MFGNAISLGRRAPVVDDGRLMRSPGFSGLMIQMLGQGIGDESGFAQPRVAVVSD